MGEQEGSGREIGALTRCAIPSPDTPFDRRQFLRQVGSIAASIALAGCGTPDGDQPRVRTSDAGESEVRTSDAGDIRRALRRAKQGETVVVDRDETLTSAIQAKSGVNIVGDGGTLTISQDSITKAVDLENTQNVVLHNLDVDGNRASLTGGGGGGGHLIGGRGLGRVSNIRVTNCRLRNNVDNAITFHGDSSSTELQDIYIAGNSIENAGRHGILFGVSPAGKIHDVIVEGNHIHDWHRAQGIGFFGEEDAEARNIAVLGNLLTQPSPTRQKNIGTIVAEEVTSESVIYGNTIDASHHDGNGPVVSKDGQRNLVARNYASVAKAGIAIQSFGYHEGGDQDIRPVTGNVATRNLIENCKHGAKFQYVEGGNAAYYNRVVGCENDFTRRNTSGADSDYVADNNGSVPEPEVGPPDVITTACSFAIGGDTVAEASWSRGSPDPDDPVTVDVTVSPQTISNG